MPRRCLLVILALAFVLVAAPWLASRVRDSLDGASLRHEPSIVLASRAPVPPGTLRVLEWNLHHGLGRELDHAGAFGNDERLLALAATIARAEADVVVLNEVDFDGVRSGGVDQAAVIARAAGFPWRAEQRNVDVQLVFAPVRYGNVVLSRHPLRDARRLELPPDRALQAWLVGHRRALSVVVEHPDGDFRVVAAHFSHRDRDTRLASAALLREHLAEAPMPTVIAGDLNATWTPLGADDALHSLVADPRLHGPLDASAGTPRLAWGPRPPHVLVDWILAPEPWIFDAFLVGEDALSDHPPVLAVLRRDSHTPAPAHRP